MRDRIRAIPLSHRSFLIAWALLCVGLFFSPFLASAGTTLCLLAILLEWNAFKRLTYRKHLLFGFPLVFLAGDLLRGVEAYALLDKGLLYLGFWIIGVGFSLFAMVLRTHRAWTMGLLIALVVGTDLMSVINYAINKEELDALLLQSKSIPVFGGMHHIHFGILNALVAVFLMHQVLFEGKSRYVPVLVALAVVLFSFHILSSRTGLLSFYLAILVVLLVYSIVQRAYWSGAIGIFLMVVVNFVAFTWSSSFQNKLRNSMEDIQSWEGEPENRNFKSMAMRFEAYWVSYAIIQQHPLAGVGEAAMMPSMHQTYQRLESPLVEENRVGPHNQLLEFGVKFGLPGALFVLIFFLNWAIRAIRPINYGALAVVLIVGLSAQFESLFERQVGIFICAALLPLSLSFLSRFMDET